MAVVLVADKVWILHLKNDLEYRCVTEEMCIDVWQSILDTSDALMLPWDKVGIMLLSSSIKLLMAFLSAALQNSLMTSFVHVVTPVIDQWWFLMMSYTAASQKQPSALLLDVRGEPTFAFEHQFRHDKLGQQDITGEWKGLVLLHINYTLWPSDNRLIVCCCFFNKWEHLFNLTTYNKSKINFGLAR